MQDTESYGLRTSQNTLNLAAISRPGFTGEGPDTKRSIQPQTHDTWRRVKQLCRACPVLLQIKRLKLRLILSTEYLRLSDELKGVSTVTTCMEANQTTVLRE
jgi:hypothetical protein